MKKSTFGLPLEYREMPEHFDAQNISGDTESKNSFIESLLRKYNVKSVLDMTCGTGSQVFFLAKHGYKITGSDFSPELLKIARTRAAKEKIDAKFIDGDMRTLKAGQFGAVITIFNAVGHLTKSGFEKAMRNIHQNLEDGGLFIFDILNLSAINDANIDDLAYYKKTKVNDTTMHTVQCSTINKTTGLLTSYESIMIQKNGLKPQRLNHQFKLQIYAIEQLREMLSKTRFEIVEQYGMDGSNFFPERTESMLIAARKK